MEKLTSIYNSLAEWKRVHPKAYRYAQKNDLIDKICEEVGWKKQKNSKDYWIINEDTFELNKPLTDEEIDDVIDFASRPNLIDRLKDEIKRIGLYKEERNVLIGYISYISRKVDYPIEPIHIVYVNKSNVCSIQNKILDLLPKYEVIKSNPVKDKDFYYLESNIQNKVFATEKYKDFIFNSISDVHSEHSLNGFFVEPEPEIETFYNIFGELKKIEVFHESAGLVQKVLPGPFCVSLEISAKMFNKLKLDDSFLILKTNNITEPKCLKSDLLINIQRVLQTYRVIIPVSKLDLFKDVESKMTIGQHKTFLNFICLITILHQFNRKKRIIETLGRNEIFLESTDEDLNLANELLTDILF